jgi:hypothetical protein
MKLNPFYAQSNISEEELYKVTETYEDAYLESGSTVAIYHNKTGELAYAHLAADFVKDEWTEKALQVAKNPFMKADLYFAMMMEQDVVKHFDFKKGDCLESYTAANPKYMGHGFYNMVFDIWFYLSATNGYKYHFGQAQTPLTIRVIEKRVQNGFTVWHKYYPYADFVLDGQRPFAHIQFKNFHRPAGSICAIGQLHSSIEKVKGVESTMQPKL